MSNPRPTVALIHASTASLNPAKSAFASQFPDAELWNLLDDRLVADADRAGGLTPALHDRMTTLIRYALDGGAAAVQLSCTMYGPVAVDAARRTDVPVLASDQAMFEHVREAGVGRVGVLGSLESAAADSAGRLRDELAKSSGDTSVVGRVAEGAAKAASAGDLRLLADLMVAAAEQLALEVDLIVIAQYSLAPTLDAIAARVSIPVLSPPHLAASTLRDQLTQDAP
jgi:aspartate/glutamate racemase